MPYAKHKDFDICHRNSNSLVDLLIAGVFNNRGMLEIIKYQNFRKFAYK